MGYHHILTWSTPEYLNLYPPRQNTDYRGQREKHDCKTVSIFGSTGTIGQKAFSIASSNNFEIVAIIGNRNYRCLIEQVLKCLPKYVCVSDDASFKIVRDALSGARKRIEVVPNSELVNVASIDVDCCVMAMSGIAALGPTFACLGHAKNLAIATKEVIISGGQYLMNQAHEKKTKIIPVDSEHSAIYQCLEEGNPDAINQIILTASGGPFLGRTEDDLDNVTIDEALAHPNWKMGKKVTIDSATMINKAIEMIEASILFDIPITKIKPLIHRESIIHGMICFVDGTFKAVLSSPDMSIPISFAMNYPNRNPLNTDRIDFYDLGSLTFTKPKQWQSRNMGLAYSVMDSRKVIAFNVANEMAVQSFLDGRIRFSEIYEYIVRILDKAEPENVNSYEDIVRIINNIPLS
ncbi:MAG: 1-deoxy-D-xylulose-5-phosphate reductoisomerase [Holosporales bacterium]|jgi:1-deoxy-D-xylulose-5-phosphate reductoisomerase|nr:1-deoxy-D-xylulose-5-phosphate reductoisomerase [Holosporales bacterium]